MKLIRYLIILFSLTSCAPLGVNQAATARPTETPHVAQLPPAWTDTPAVADNFAATNTATDTAEPATATSTMIPVTLDPNAPQIMFMQAGECTAMTVSTSGGSAAPLTLNPPADCASAKISPNGEQMAYFGELENSTIFLANVNGSEQMTLGQIRHFEVEDLLMPVLDVIWAPNGERLAVVSESAYLVGFGDLYLIDPSGGRDAQYFSLGPVDVNSSPYVSWSPDGKWLLYHGLISHRGNLPDDIPIAQRLSDSHFNVINDYDGFFPGDHLDWSPDSRSLSVIFEMLPFSLYDAELPQDQQIMTVAALSGGEDTQHKYVLLPALGEADGWGVWNSHFGIRWSPDGSSFLALQRQSRTLSVLNADGTLRNTVVSLSAEPVEAGWSPDGEWIYYLTSWGTLEIVRPDGTQLRTLAEDAALGPIVWK